jgi:monoamine oxidase
MSLSILIIGAGAAGLQAARNLSAAGCRVILLEAAAEPGGRILHLTPEGFSMPIEGGAEFVHGLLPLSLGLAKEAGIALQPVKAEMVREVSAANGEARNGEMEEEDGMGADWGELMQAMAGLSADLPFADFLESYFPGERYQHLKDSARRFAEGYDLADLRRASTLSLYREWSEEMTEEEEWRPAGGYRRMIDLLAKECNRNGVELYCSSPVTEVSWEPGRVVARTAGGRVFSADRMIVSVSLGVLEAGGLRFQPGLPGLDAALRQMGYGSVVKILLEFRRPFWREKKPLGRTLFVISDQAVPTWWTQTGEESRLLTGWLAGEKMQRFLQLDEDGRLDSCLRSLAAIFSRDLTDLRAELEASLILDWGSAPFVRGGYSFETVGAKDARALLSRSFDGTIHFCGEAFYEGRAPGTVEAALCSGQAVAAKIIKHDGRGDQAN